MIIAGAVALSVTLSLRTYFNKELILKLLVPFIISRLLIYQLLARMCGIDHAIQSFQATSHKRKSCIHLFSLLFYFLA